MVRPASFLTVTLAPTSTKADLRCLVGDYRGIVEHVVQSHYPTLYERLLVFGIVKFRIVFRATEVFGMKYAIGNLVTLLRTEMMKLLFKLLETPVS